MKKTVSKVRKVYIARLAGRCGILIASVLLWILAREEFEVLEGMNFFKKFSVFHLLWGIWLLDMYSQLVPVKGYMALGSQKRWAFISKLFHHRDSTKINEESHRRVMAIVRACMSMSKNKTGALIVIQQDMPLDNIEMTGDNIDAALNSRLIENIFFKNSPLHDGAMIIAGDRIKAAGCILPVSHDTSIPRYMGLRHRSALGISQASDAIAVVVSEETGNISIAHNGEIKTHLSTADLEQRLNQLVG